MTRDENDRLRDGSLPSDPEADAAPIGPDGKPSEPHPIVRTWKTLGELGDVFGTTPPKRRWLLRRGAHGVLPLGKLGILAAAGGVGKTMACVQLAIAIATGRKWLEAFTVAPEGVGRVLLALGEEDEEEVRRRMFNAARAMRLTQSEKSQALERVVILPLVGLHVALTQAENDRGEVETAAVRALRTKMAEGEWRLVVLDPLSRFAGPDAELSNAAATRFIETAESFCKLPGSPTVLVVHHSAQHARAFDPKRAGAPRDASLVARGATGITDGARWVAALEPEHTTLPDEQLTQLVVLSVVKNNYAQVMHESIALRRLSDHAGALRELDSTDCRRLHEDRQRRSHTPIPVPASAPTYNPDDGPDLSDLA